MLELLGSVGNVLTGTWIPAVLTGTWIPVREG